MTARACAASEMDSSKIDSRWAIAPNSPGHVTDVRTVAVKAAVEVFKIDPTMAKPKAQKSLLVHRSIKISGRKSSLNMEAAFWNGLKEIATAKGVSATKLVSMIDQERPHNLSSAIRLFVLDHYRRR